MWLPKAPALKTAQLGWLWGLRCASLPTTGPLGGHEGRPGHAQCWAPRQGMVCRVESQAPVGPSPQAPCWQGRRAIRAPASPQVSWDRGSAKVSFTLADGHVTCRQVGTGRPEVQSQQLPCKTWLRKSPPGGPVCCALELGFPVHRSPGHSPVRSVPP